MTIFTKKISTFIIIIIVGIACKPQTVASDDNNDDVTDNPSVADATVGCTDPLATNYKSAATTDDCGCEYNYSSKVATKNLPASFKRYALVEEYTGTWCGWCPIGKENMEKVVSNYSAIGVEIHFNDEMELKEEIYTPLKKIYGNPAFPTGMVNRQKSVIGSTIIMGAEDWEANVKNWLSKGNSPIGIALESELSGNQLRVMVHLKFAEKLDGKYGLGIYLVEDKVVGYPQMNYLSRNAQFKEYAAYNKPAEITDILHNGVTRAAIAPITNGYDIPKAALQEGKIYNKLIEKTLTNAIANSANFRLVAFVLNEKNEIQNVKAVSLKSVGGWE